MCFINIREGQSMPIMICDWCGKNVRKQPRDAKKQYHFCNRECSNAWRREQIPINAELRRSRKARNYQENREEIRQAAMEEYHKDPERYRQAKRDEYFREREKILIRNRAWREANPDKVKEANST